MDRRIKTQFIIALIAACLGAYAGNKKGTQDNHYWDWGWGAYATIGEPLDAARFDWSIIALGSVDATRGLERANEILKINPDHKFLLRLWPVGNLGQSPKNNYYMTMFDYFYRDGIKEKVLKNTRDQVEFFMKGLSKPENLAGICFLEEIPHHISSNPFLYWRKEKPMPWDIEAYGKEIQKELGEPFDMMNPKHRLWWGKKYVQMLDDIHKTIKEASGGKKVLYWQQSSMIGTLDELQPGEAMIKPTGQSPVPIYYKDIVKPGFCDGIFGYPGNKIAMKKRCEIPAEKINCLYFTQLSVPAFMRTGSWDDSIKGARNNDPRNLGTFFHIENYLGNGAWNMVPWHRDNKDKFDNCVADYRKAAAVYEIGEKILEENLKPEVKFDYNVKNLKKGAFAHVFVQIFNPISPSWYDGNIEKSTFRNLSVKLEIPEGFELPPENNPPEHIELGSLKPYECIVSDWWIRKTRDETTPENLTFKAVVKWGNGKETTVRAIGSDVDIPSLQPHYIRDNEEKWVEPAYRLSDFKTAVKITPLGKELVSPELTSGNYTLRYDGTVGADEELIIIGDKAEIKHKNLFPPEILRFKCDKPEGAIFSEGFVVYQTPKVLVKPGEKYIFNLTGMAKDNGNTVVNAVFFCGKETKTIPNLFANLFTDQMKTLSTEISIPEFNPGNKKVFVKFCFYRFKRKGTVIYKNFSFLPKNEVRKDVSAKLQGDLRQLKKNVTIWQFKDKSNNYWGKKAAVKFFNPEDKKEMEAENLPYF